MVPQLKNRPFSRAEGEQTDGDGVYTSSCGPASPDTANHDQQQVQNSNKSDLKT